MAQIQSSCIATNSSNGIAARFGFDYTKFASILTLERFAFFYKFERGFLGSAEPKNEQEQVSKLPISHVLILPYLPCHMPLFCCLFFDLSARTCAQAVRGILSQKLSTLFVDKMGFRLRLFSQKPVFLNSTFPTRDAMSTRQG